MCMLKKSLLKNKSIILELAGFIFIALLLAKVDFSTDNDAEFYYEKEDIYYEYQAAQDIQDGKNPYLRILSSDMLENDKYATQFPLYFYFLGFVNNLAHNDFSGFLEIYRAILYCFHLAGGVFIYLIFRRVNARLIGFCAAFFYMFNVWSLNSFLFLKQDMIAIALLLLSFNFFKTKSHRWLSYVLFGLSLGVKHIGVFALPLYIYPVFVGEDSVKKFSNNLLLLFITLMLPTFPLFLDSPESFYKSLLFSLTRSPSTSEVLYGYNNLLVNYNPTIDKGTMFDKLLPRLPLLVAFVLGALLLFTKKIPPSKYLFVSILIFAVFNPVIFPQYITWIPPLALIAFVDYIGVDSTKKT